MPARPWPLATTLAAVALTTTSCVAGPTITDEKKPAAATAGAPSTVAVGPQPGTGATAPGPVWVPPSGAVVTTAPGATPSEAPQSVGSSTPFTFAGGVNTWVERMTVAGADVEGSGDSVRIAVQIRVENGTTAVFRPHDLDIQLMACPEIGGACQKRSGSASEEPQTVAANGRSTVVRYFAAKRSNLTAPVTLVVTYKAQHVKYAGVPGA